MATPRATSALGRRPSVDAPSTKLRVSALELDLLSRTVTRAREGTAMAAPLTAPRTSFNGTITGHRSVALADMSLDDIKAIKNAAGVTVNDAVVAICAGAMRSWLEERGELPAEPLVSMVPVSVRKREEMGSFGNRVSTMFVPIPTDEADPRRRARGTGR